MVIDLFQDRLVHRMRKMICVKGNTHEEETRIELTRRGCQLKQKWTVVSHWLLQKKNCRTEKCISKSSIERCLCGLRNTSPCFVTKDLISRFYLQNCQGNPEKKSKAGACFPRLQAIITKL